MNERLLLQLPIPQKNRRGWPWSEETEIHCIDQNITYPKISIIVPSYNQCEFIEETIRSILLQNYPNLELIIIDGGSNDGTVDIIKRYDSWINYWISEDDKGQSYAINKGFQKVTGDWVGWQNSDDIYLTNAFFDALALLNDNHDADILYSNAMTIDEESKLIHKLRYAPFNFGELKYSGWGITNQACFFRKAIIDQFRINEELKYTMDADFFWKIANARKKFVHSKNYWGCFRYHNEAKTSNINMTVGWEEYKALRKRYNVQMSDKPWSSQYRVRKLYYKIRKGIYYLPELLFKN